MVIVIGDEGDERLGLYADVAAPDRLKASGHFVVEGRLGVERLISTGRYQIESLLLSETAYRALQPVLSALSPETPVFVCAPDYFERSTGHDFHRGCLGLARRPLPLDWVDLASSALRLVVLEAVANADNVGGVFRNAAAFGVDAVLLSPTTSDPLYRKTVRTSMGASLSVPFARLGTAPGERWPDCLEQLRARGFQLVALTPREPAVDLDEFAVRASSGARSALIVGSEGPGLSPAVEQMADVRVRIAISSRVDSLNLAVATGIALSRLWPARAV